MKRIIVTLAIIALAAPAVLAGECCGTKETSASVKGTCKGKTASACHSKVTATKNLVRSGAKGATLLLHS